MLLFKYITLRLLACSCSLCKSEFNGIRLEESAPEPSSVIHGVIGVPADGTASADVAAPESLNPGSPVHKGKRKAADTKDGPESKANRKAATIEDYSGSKDFLDKVIHCTFLYCTHGYICSRWIVQCQLTTGMYISSYAKLGQWSHKIY